MREEGYYWVRVGGQWIVGFYGNDQWILMASLRLFDSSYFDEIDERKIERSIACACKDEIKHGETSIMCCNHCGLPTESFWTKKIEL